MCVHDAFALGDSLTDQEVKKDLKCCALSQQCTPHRSTTEKISNILEDAVQRKSCHFNGGGQRRTYGSWTLPSYIL